MASWWHLECVGVVLVDLILRLYMAQITCCCNVSAICGTVLLIAIHQCSVYSLPYARMMSVNLKAVIPTAASSSLWLWRPPLLVEGCQIQASIASNGNIAVDPVSLHFKMTIIAYADVLPQNWKKSMYILLKNDTQVLIICYIMWGYVWIPWIVACLYIEYVIHKKYGWP